jgi:hypothetical protein
VDGTRFEDVSEAAGVRVSERGQAVGKALGVVACDPDHDNYPDLLVANDTVRNFFFHNVAAPGGGRRFEEIGLTANVAYADGRPRGGMGIDAAELRPGLLSAVIANFTNEPNTLLTVARDGALQFRDSALADGLAGPSRGPMKFGAVFLDFDFDGRPDLLTANGHLEPDIARVQSGQTHAQPAQLFRNTGRADGGLFQEASAGQVGPDLFRPVVGRGCATLDFDRDGDLDVVLTANGGPPRLLRNDNRTGNRSLMLELAGDGRAVNRDGLGVEVTVVVGEEARRFYLAGARGYLSQGEPVISVGLGRDDAVTRVRVRWPGSAVPQEWSSLAAGGRYRLTRDRLEPERIER